MQNIALINNSISKWRLSAPDIQELPLLAASSKMRLLIWLANRGNPAMSPHAKGKKGTCYNDIVYTAKKREGEGEQPRNYTRKQNGPTKNMRDPLTCGSHMTADYTGLPMLAQHMHCAGA